MITTIAATILLADNGDSGNGGWIQLVVFVVLGLIYAMGGIAKMKANKAAEEEENKPEERSKQQPRYKPLDEMFAPRQARPKRTPTPSSGPSRITPRPARQIQRPTQLPVHREYRHPVRAPEVKRRRLVRPAAKPKLPEVKKGTQSSITPSELGKIEKLEIELSKKQQSEEVIGFSDRPFFDYEDSDYLRNAILHFEILGKPIALRESGRHIWEQ